MLARHRVPRLHGRRNRGRQGARTIAGELFVDLFEAADEVEDFAAGVGSAGGGAEMGAAAEGTVFVDEAAGGLRIEERAGAVGAGREGLASGGFEGAGGEEGFAAGEIRGFAGEFEMAALGAQLAVALDRTRGEVAVDGADFVECGGRGRPPSSGAHG